jgi:hypothetical protein
LQDSKGLTSVRIHGKHGITLPPPLLVKSSPAIDEYKSENSAAPVKVTDNYRWLENVTAPDTRFHLAC